MLVIVIKFIKETKRNGRSNNESVNKLMRGFARVL